MKTAPSADFQNIFFASKAQKQPDSRNKERERERMREGGRERERMREGGRKREGAERKADWHKSDSCIKKFFF
jgi:hypothetical protein